MFILDLLMCSGTLEHHLFLWHDELFCPDNLAMFILDLLTCSRTLEHHLFLWSDELFCPDKLADLLT